MSGLVVVPGAVNGIDMCSIQESAGPIDARAIRDAGFEYAYVKSSQYSSTADSRFDRLVETLSAVGIACGAYHFCSQATDPAAQAEFFYKQSRGLGKNPGELPPMADWEYCTPTKYPDHPKHCVDWLVDFMEEVQSLWYPNSSELVVPRYPVVYTYPFYSGRHQPALEEAGGLAGYPLNLASYANDGHVPGSLSELPFHTPPKPWSKATLCQYSGTTGQLVPGIKTPCDRQVFLGTRSEWAAFLGYGELHQ